METQPDITLGLRAYLNHYRQGYSLSPEREQALRKEYKRLYDRIAKRTSRDKKHEVSVRFTQKDYQVLERLAHKHKIPIAQLITNIAVAYMHKRELQPDKAAMEQLIVEVTRIASHIRILARHPNTNERASFLDLANTVAGIEEMVRKTFTSSKPLHVALEEFLLHHPTVSEDSKVLLEYLKGLEHDSEGINADKR